jgi:aarF domain-containing kinase
MAPYVRWMIRAASRRPVVSSVLSAGVGVSSYLCLVEYRTTQLTRRFKDNQPDLEPEQLYRVQLPRQYHGDAVRSYWSYRPITTIIRTVEIASYLFPLAMAHARDFYIIPQLGNLAGTILPNHDSSSSSSSPSCSLELQRTHAIAWRQALTALGPAFVKAGQQVSIRPDLVSAVVLTELQQLCDAVPPVPDHVALTTLCRELQVSDLDQVFAEPLVFVAAASLGQVYKTRLKSNHQAVAVKVQRPDMLTSFSLDLYLLQLIGSAVDVFTSTFTNQPPFHTALYDSFAGGSYSELDYEHEAANQLLFRTELAARSCPVVIPNVYQSTRTILVTEWMDGIRLSDAPVEQIRRLIPVGVELFLTQLLDLGHFHADPHVGNLLVLKDGRLCLLDFGLCTEISAADRRAMTSAIWHLLQRDFSALVHHDTKALGFLPESFDTTQLLPILTKILTVGLLDGNDNEQGFSLSNLRHRHRKLREISQELNEVFFAYPFTVPPFFALVTRGLGILEGIALQGDPAFDIFQAAAPYARRRAMQMLSRQSRSVSRTATTASN